MCGICGLIGIDSYDAIVKMVEVQNHRGPDDNGIENLNKTPPIFFGHNRLSIIDLSSLGHQPMFNANRSLCIVYNGEVYDFESIREELMGLGHSFLSRTDTEVILKAYEQWGMACLEKFNGMFAFAIYDGKKKKIFIARDRLGVKPLYYWESGGQFAFASEIKALLQLEEIRDATSLDMEAFVSYVSLLWCPSISTPFKNIKRLPPASYMDINLETGEFIIKSFWDVSDKQVPRNQANSKEEVLELLSRSVKDMMVADVKVGAFLSGGLDSSAITALMAPHATETIEAFTIAFSRDDQQVEAMMDDFRYAKKMSDKFGFHLNKIEITAQKTIDLLPKIVYHLDEPVGDPAAINTFLMSKLAKDKGVAVLLSGQGSDEIFGGYRKYLACIMLEKYKRLTPSIIQALLNGIISKLPVMAGNKGIRLTRWAKRLLLEKHDDPFKNYFAMCMFLDTLNLSKILKEEIFRHFTDEAHQKFFNGFNGSYLNRMCFTDTKLFLPGLNLNYCDKATMAASIECRVPFCDHDIVEYAFSLPDNLRIKNLSQKYILKKAMENVLPSEVIYRPKMPFSSPIRSWVKNDFKALINDYLSKDRLEKQGLFNYKGVQTLIEEDRQGIKDNAHVIYGLLTMQIWLDVFGVG